MSLILNDPTKRSCQMASLERAIALAAQAHTGQRDKAGARGHDLTHHPETRNQKPRNPETRNPETRTQKPETRT